jgi:rRNA-processing protein FCF1
MADRMFKRCKVVICGRHTGWVLKEIVGNCNMGLCLVLTECQQISDRIRKYCVALIVLQKGAAAVLVGCRLL